MIKDFTTDERGVSEVIGAILVFGLLIALLAVMQTTAIPAANEQVEFNHNERVQSDIIEYHTSATEAAASGESESETLEMGARYPSRLLFFNPSSPAGQLQASDDREFSLENVDSDDEIVNKYLNGDVTLETNHISYTPRYNEYRSAPTTRYEYGMIYDNHTDSQLVENSGSVISDRNINLMVTEGDMSTTTSGTIALSANPSSEGTRSVPVSGDGGPLVLNLPTQMGEDKWSESLESERVQSVSKNDGSVRVELDGDQTYTLRMPRVGVGSTTPDQEATYLYPNSEFTVPRGQAHEVGVEVRDRYNNPISGEDVLFEVDGAGSIADRTVTSDSSGSADAIFNAPSSPQKVNIQATLHDNFSNFTPDSDPKDISTEVWVTDFGAFGSNPTVSLNGRTGTCDTDGFGDAVDNPIGSIFGEDAGAVAVNWSATLSDPETTIDSVELRLVEQTSRQVVDSAEFSYEDKSSVGSITGLVQPEGCGNSYDFRVIATTTGGATDIEDGSATASGSGGGDNGDDGGCLLGLC